MVLIVDDKSKDKVLDAIAENIIKLEIKYEKEWHWLGPIKRAELRETIALHVNNYNTLVTKRANRAKPNKLPSLYQPGPQSDVEKLQLNMLIDSV